MGIVSKPGRSGAMVSDDTSWSMGHEDPDEIIVDVAQAARIMMDEPYYKTNENAERLREQFLAPKPKRHHRKKKRK